MENFEMTEANRAMLEADTILLSKGNRTAAEGWLTDNDAWAQSCLHARRTQAELLSR
jgi:hypothetical protein